MKRKYVEGRRSVLLGRPILSEGSSQLLIETPLRLQLCHSLHPTTFTQNQLHSLKMACGRLWYACVIKVIYLLTMWFSQIGESFGFHNKRGCPHQSGSQTQFSSQAGTRPPVHTHKPMVAPEIQNCQKRKSILLLRVAWNHLHSATQRHKLKLSHYLEAAAVLV